MAEEQPTTGNDAQDEVERRLTLEETMERLSVGRAQVYRKVKDGALKGEKADGALTFPESVVEELKSVTQTHQDAVREKLDRWLAFYAERLTQNGVEDLPDMTEKTDDERAGELVRRLVLDGVLSGVSDIYLDPLYEGARLLSRSQGNARELARFEKDILDLVRAKLKALGPLPEPSPGMIPRALFRHTHEDRGVQIGLSAVPTILGEQVHLHFYDALESPTLCSVGYTDDQVAALRALLTGRPGLFLCAGAADPASDRQGLALANELSASGRLVVSLERRIQYRSELLVQLEVGGEGRPGFDEMWQTALAMGPDVLLLDDVPDATAARGLLEAVSAGAVVVAMVRASTVAEALARLIGFELDREALSRSVLGFAERASLRRPCPQCREARAATPEEAASLGVPPDSAVAQPRGCEACGDGFQGRASLFGLLPGDDALRDLIRSGDPSSATLAALQGRNPLSLAAAVRGALMAGELAVEDARVYLRQPVSPETESPQPNTEEEI